MPEGRPAGELSPGEVFAPLLELAAEPALTRNTQPPSASRRPVTTVATSIDARLARRRGGRRFGDASITAVSRAAVAWSREARQAVISAGAVRAKNTRRLR